jgi:hypothetical protein
MPAPTTRILPTGQSSQNDLTASTASTVAEEAGVQTARRGEGVNRCCPRSIWPRGESRELQQRPRRQDVPKTLRQPLRTGPGMSPTGRPCCPFAIRGDAWRAE